MGEGVDREGHHLYPGFPYDHFTRITADDNRALYAYLMTREPVRAEAPANELPWPLQFRPLLAGWKLLFLDRARSRTDPARSPEWNRGAYLAEGSPIAAPATRRATRLAPAKTERKFAGGESEGWHAPALNAASTAPVPWDQDSLYAVSAHRRQRGPCVWPPARWLPWSATCRSCRTRTSGRWRPISPTAWASGEPAPPAEARRRPGNGAATVYAGACATATSRAVPCSSHAPGRSGEGDARSRSRTRAT